MMLGTFLFHVLKAEAGRLPPCRACKDGEDFDDAGGTPAIPADRRRPPGGCGKLLSILAIPVRVCPRLFFSA